jgi:hypothetical protein
MELFCPGVLFASVAPVERRLSMVSVSGNRVIATFLASAASRFFAVSGASFPPPVWAMKTIRTGSVVNSARGRAW